MDDYGKSVAAHAPKAMNKRLEKAANAVVEVIDKIDKEFLDWTEDCAAEFGGSPTDMTFLAVVDEECNA